MSDHKELSNAQILTNCNTIISSQTSKFIIYEKCDMLEKIRNVADNTNYEVLERPEFFTDCNNNFIQDSLKKFSDPIPSTTFKATSLIFSHSLAKMRLPAEAPVPGDGPIPIYPDKYRFEIKAIFQDTNNMFSLNPDLMISSNYSIISQVAKSIENTTESTNSHYEVLAEFTPNDNGFNWEDLQFHQLLSRKHKQIEGHNIWTNDRDLDKIEVGLWELLELIRYSDYIGISGARVSTGNHRLKPDMTELVLGDNRDYFTLKFTGFRRETSRTSVKGYDDSLVLTTNNRYINKSSESSKSSITPSNIPATVWGSPCPPHWIPQ